MKFSILSAALVGAVLLTGCASMQEPMGKRELMLVANDEKQNWDDNGKVILSGPGRCRCR